MATVYKRMQGSGVRGKAMAENVAYLPGVQAELEARAFEIAVRAEALLINHRQDGHAEIELVHGDIDYYVVLSDERGQKAALSIEFGREGIRDEDGNFILDDNGKKVGEMDGLYILAQASNLPKKRKGKVVNPLNGRGGR